MVNATRAYQKHGFINIKANAAFIMFTLDFSSIIYSTTEINNLVK